MIVTENKTQNKKKLDTKRNYLLWHITEFIFFLNVWFPNNLT